MSSGPDGGGGGGGREIFLSAHRCPEVDLVPRHDCETRVPPLCSLAAKSPELTCSGQSESNYLDVSSTCRSEDEKDEQEEEEEEESISDWSEEDLSLHFSPSVILPSDDEESDPESGFECVDVTVETVVRGQEGEGLKMVPKRQIQLKRKDADIVTKETTEKLQVIPKDGPAKRRGDNSDVSANELLCPTVRQRPDLLLRQHSMPASLHVHSTTSGDVDSYRVYRGLVAGASQGVHVGGSSRQRLQKSFSLDETKTKMASCIIKSVLSKKMQVEQENLQRTPAVLPGLPLQRVREGGGALAGGGVEVGGALAGGDVEVGGALPGGGMEVGGALVGGGVAKAPVHVVRDVRSLVKNTYSLSFSTTTPDNRKTTSFKVIGQEESPPPTYQQAVGVKVHDEAKRGWQVATSISQSQHRMQNRLSRPITEQRRGSEPIINRRQVGDVMCNLSELSQSERGASQPPPRPPERTQPQLSTQDQSSVLGVSCFYAPPTLQSHLGRVSYMPRPLSYIHTTPGPPGPGLHLLRGSDQNQSETTRIAGDQESNSNTSAAREQQGKQPEQPEQRQRHQQPEQHQRHQQPEQPEQRQRHQQPEQHQRHQQPEQPEQRQRHQQHQQQFVCGVQGFSPAQVGTDFLVDITGSAAAPGALLSGPAPCHVMVDPQSGRCFYVDTPPQPQRKMLLDPETGQYVQVFLPAASSVPQAAVFPVRCVNPAPFAPAVMNGVPTVLSVMQFQPTVGVPSLYAPPCLPFTLHTPSVNFNHAAP